MSALQPVQELQIGGTRPVDRPAPPLYKVPAQYQRSRGPRTALNIIILSPPGFLKAGARVKLARRQIVLLDLEEHGPQAKAREAPQGQIKELSRKTFAAGGPRNRNRKNFGLIGGAARHDETQHLNAARDAIRDDA